MGKNYLYLILGALVQTLIFQDGAGGHFGFGPLAKNAGIFARGRVSNCFMEGQNMLAGHGIEILDPTMKGADV